MTPNLSLQRTYASSAGWVAEFQRWEAPRTTFIETMIS